MVVEGWMVSTVVTVVGFVGHAAYVKGVFGTKIAEHDRRLDHLEGSVVFTDTCKANHEPLNVMRNGKLKSAK